MAEDKGKPTEGEGGEKKNETSEAIRTMMEGLQGVVTLVTELKDQVEEMKSKPAPTKETEPEEDPRARDLEKLSRSEFAQFLLDQVSGVVKESLNPIADKLGSVENRTHQDNIRGQVKDLTTGENARKDFFDWQQEMSILSKDNPTLNVKQLYNLARTENPSKASDLDKKYKEPEPEKKSEFGGLTPSSTVVVEKTDMQANEAAETAFDKIMSGVPDLANEEAV